MKENSNVCRKPKGNKPVHLRRAFGTNKTGRDAMWEQIREQREFTFKSIAHEINLPTDSVRDYVRGLEKAGYIVRDGHRIEHRLAPQILFKLVRDVGVDAPRVNKQGKKVTQGEALEQIWRTMKIIGEFSVNELAFTASTDSSPVSSEQVRPYVFYLREAGYLIQTRERSGPKAPRFRLLQSKFTGPRPPQVQRSKSLYDPNIDKVVYRRNSNGK